MTIAETMSYIHSVEWRGSRPGLERIGHLLHAIGDPQKGMRFVHVAGTNGKGSVCAMTESILRSAHYRTGLFTSPYIYAFNERMAVDGNPISDEELSDITALIRPYADKMEDKPTEFELVTAIGFEYFRRHKCDVVVLEVGMGGRLDSTNIIEDPVACVITGISKDHTKYLGNTIAEIAAEKAGILKPGAPVVFGGEDQDAVDVIRKREDEMREQYVQFNPARLEIRRADLSGCVFDYRRRKELSIGLAGLYQARNASVVLDLIDLLNVRGFSISEEQIREGLKNAVWRGRFEILSKDPPLIYDGSHNPEGIGAAVASIGHYFPGQKIHLLTGVMADKDFELMAKTLAPVVCDAVTVRPDNPRALDAKDLADIYRREGVPARPAADIKSAVRDILAAAAEDGNPAFALGSLYMYGAIKDAVLEK